MFAAVRNNPQPESGEGVDLRPDRAWAQVRDDEPQPMSGVSLSTVSSSSEESARNCEDKAETCTNANNHQQRKYSADILSDKTSASTMSKNERTFIAIKPDAVQRGIIGKVISRFEERGYKLVAMKMVHATKPHLEIHYQELKDKPFFKTLIEYMSSGPVVAMVWEGLDVVKQGRLMLGATNPLASNPGTIRGDYSIQTGRNIVHGSDSLESANREIAHWFKKEELVEWTPANVNWVYE
ncbi:unnamed protein product [Anisakis simplex]|uniref:Nucleoside diphosphate kinase n=1 Tax=Anisakis simplex TaxID=6269 RepID=A0A0M3K9I2_ANISI|nr:unnamed protein product [Anisakis simplex]